MTRSFPRRAGGTPVFLVPLLLCSLGAATPLLAADAGERYTRALAHERELRSPRPGQATLAHLRDAVDRYESIVRDYPRSGYSDNALWQAAGLALEAFERYGESADRELGTRLLRMLEREYPSSSLVPRIATRLERAPAAAPSTTPRAGAVRLRSITRETLSDVVRVTVELEDEVHYTSDRLDGPARLFFDLGRTDVVPALLNATLPFDDGDVIREIRLGRHPEGTTRVVLDVEGVESYSVYSLYNPYRLVVDTVRLPVVRHSSADSAADADLAGRALPAPLEIVQSVSVPAWLDDASEPDPSPTAQPVSVPAPLADAINRASPPREPLAGAASPDLALMLPPVPAGPLVSETAPPAPTTMVATQPGAAVDLVAATWAPPPPVANVDGAYSLGRQLGLGISRVVIDPGHGGYDPGARTGELTEAELVLDVAERLEARLQANGIEVVMTRRQNVYVPLRARTEMANLVDADIFLSIHANASENPRKRGIETYYLDFANDPTAQALAARENAASADGMHDLTDLVRSIALDNKVHESRELAGLVQEHLIDGVRQIRPDITDLGVKQAPFRVLIGATMPSVLTEISFLSNEEAAAHLATSTYRDRIADALFAAIVGYQRTLKPVTSVAANN